MNRFSRGLATVTATTALAFAPSCGDNREEILEQLGIDKCSDDRPNIGTAISIDELEAAHHQLEFAKGLPSIEIVRVAITQSLIGGLLIQPMVEYPRPDKFESRPVSEILCEGSSESLWLIDDTAADTVQYTGALLAVHDAAFRSYTSTTVQQG